MNPWSRQRCARRSSSTRSRRISASAEPKMTALPARLPKIGSLFSQNGSATSPPTTVGTPTAKAIQYQLSSFTSGRAAPKLTEPVEHEVDVRHRVLRLSLLHHQEASAARDVECGIRVHLALVMAFMQDMRD